MLELAIRVAREVGHLLRERYTGPHTISVKGLRDITTEADLEAEALAIRLITEGCPGARFMAEESETAYLDHSPEPTWYIDPIDGTTNFARGIPMFSCSIAMVQDGRTQCGVVYDPMVDQLFYGERGQGAYLDERRLQVSERSELMDCIAMLDWPRRQPHRQMAADFLARLASKVDAVRSRGSAALSLAAVAAGWADIYYQYTLSAWDVAAGVLLVEEAGGTLTNLRGDAYHLHQPDWLVTNGLVHEAVLAMEPARA